MQPVEIILEFSEMILESFWSDYNVLIWNLNKLFQSFIEYELLAFINNTQIIVSFLRSKFHRTNELDNFCQGLEIWESITPFFVISTIEDKEVYKKLLDFNTYVKLFYDAGKINVLTKHSIGNNETFYLHCPRYYLTQTAKETFEEHNLGIGIFTMQGFERRNEKAKNTMKRFSNNKGNVVVANVKKILDVYHNNHYKV